MAGNAYNFMERDSDCQSQIAALKIQIQKLREDFLKFTSPGYRKVFSTSGTNNSATFYPQTHCIKNVTSVIVLDPDGNEVGVHKEIRADQTVYISSNLPLVNFKIIIN